MMGNDTNEPDETPGEANRRRADTGAAILAHYLTLEKTDVEGMVESLEDDNGPVLGDQGRLTDVLTDLLTNLLHLINDPTLVENCLVFARSRHFSEVHETS